MKLAECDSYYEWLQYIKFEIPPNLIIAEPEFTQCAASMLAFSETVPISLLYDQCLIENRQNKVVGYVLEELWAHYTIPSIIEQAKSVLFPRTQLVANRLLDLPGIDKEKVAGAIFDAVKMPWNCDLYSPSTRIMMDMAQTIGITFVSIDKKTEDPSLGVVYIGQYKYGITIRGKALLTILLSLWMSKHAKSDFPTPLKTVKALLQKQN